MPIASDAGIPDAGLAIAAPMPPAQPDATWSDCPEGWTMSDGACEPWPDDGACAPHELRVPGRACERLGSACEGEFAPDLPASGVIFVAPGGMGDGTRADPYGTIAEAIAAASPGDTIALRSGTYAASVALPAGVTLHGACVEGTIVRGAIGGVTEGTISVRAAASLRNLTIEGERPGIVIHAGTLDVAAVRIEGARVAGVLIIGGGLRADGLIVRGTRAEVASGLAGRGVDVEPGGSAEISRALIEGNHDFGVFAAGPLVLTDAVVRDTQMQLDGTHGRGVNVIGGASARIERTVVERSHETGVFASQASTIELTDVLVRTVEPVVDDGAGVSIEMGSTGMLARVRIEDTSGAGLSVSRSNVTARELVVRDVAPEIEAGDRGFGVDVFANSAATIERVLIERTRAAAIAVNLGASLIASDLIVRDVGARELEDDMGNGVIALGSSVELTRARIERTAGEAVSIADGTTARIADLSTASTGADGRSGDGLLVYLGATLEGDRISIDDAADVSVSLGGEGTRVVLRDLTITGGRAVPTGDPEVTTYAGGIQVEDRGVLELTRALLDGALERAIGVWLPGAELRAVDLDVRDTRESADGRLGRGAVAAEGGLLALERARFAGGHEIGIFGADPGTAIALTDVELLDTESSTNDGRLGRAITLQEGAALTMLRVSLRGNREVGILAGDEGTHVEGDAVEIADTRRRACADTSCEGSGAGIGLSVHSDAHVELADFVVRDNALCGVQLASGATVVLRGGTIAGHPIGANVQDSAFDYETLDGVEFVDNERNVDATMLPLPETGLDDR